MHAIETAISGVYILESPIFQDQRGAFSGLFCNETLNSIIVQRSIVQINHSRTDCVGAIRGMHYQHMPYGEMKIIRCLRGQVFDVALDLRHNSPTFLKWVSVELSPENYRAFVIPEGCAHGFQVLEPKSELLYLHTAFYTPSAEGAVRFDDPRVGISWPCEPKEISIRDHGYPYLDENFMGIVV